MEMLSGSGGRRQEYEDFVQRFERGAPWEGIDDDEAQRRYEEVASRLDDDGTSWRRGRRSNASTLSSARR